MLCHYDLYKTMHSSEFIFQSLSLYPPPANIVFKTYQYRESYLSHKNQQITLFCKYYAMYLLICLEEYLKGDLLLLDNTLSFSNTKQPLSVYK